MRDAHEVPDTPEQLLIRLCNGRKPTAMRKGAVAASIILAAACTFGLSAATAATAASTASVWGPEQRFATREYLPLPPHIEVNGSGAAIGSWEDGGASGRLSAVTSPAFEDADGAFIDRPGDALVIRFNVQQDNPYSYVFTTRQPGGAWTPEEAFTVPGHSGLGTLAMSQSGYLGAVLEGTQPNTSDIVMRDPSGQWLVAVSVPQNPLADTNPLLVVNDDGSAVAAFGSLKFVNQRQCHVTQVGGRNADGSTRPLVTLAQRCDTHGADTGDGLGGADLSASSSGLGAVLSWTTDGEAPARARLGVAVRGASGNWLQHLMPTLNGTTVASTVSAAGGNVWAWWAVQGAHALTIYSARFAKGTWSAPSVLRTYQGATVRVVSLASGVGTNQRAVAWTVQPRPGSLFVSKLRTVHGGAAHEEDLGSRTRVGDLSVRGRHDALIEYRQDPGPRSQDVIIRTR
jgi:hypothetical protein